jgi:succinoglycan biosynthesis protein ExoA
MTQSLTVSIIIPMRNEAKYIGKCLDSILTNDFPQDKYEILVVDGRSTDNSKKVVAQRAEQSRCVRLLDNPQQIVPPALNRAIRESKGRYIIRMDAHSEYPPSYIRTCIEELEATGATNVGGRWITLPGSNSIVARAIALLTQNAIAVGNAAYRTGQQGRYVDTVPFGAFRREIFDQVGLFREDLVRNQDYELNARIRKVGGTIFLSPKLFVKYYNVPTFSKFMRQAYLNGLWVARMWIRYPLSFYWRHAAPLCFSVCLIGLFGLGALYKLFLMAAIAALSAYSLCAVAAALQIASRNGWKFLFVVPPLMFSYHFVYGISTALGLILPGRKQAVASTGGGLAESRM